MKFGRWVVLTTVVVAVAGCSTEIPKVDKATLEKQVFDLLAAQWGHKPQAVQCPEGLDGQQGAKQTCFATDDGVDYNVVLTTTEVNGTVVKFKLDTGAPLTLQTEQPEVYVGREELARSVSDQLAAQYGGAPLIKCPNDLPAILDATVTCYLHDGADVFDAVVKVKQLDGDNIVYDVQVNPKPR